VYLSYGIHSLLNAVCEPDGQAAAVLIRALRPTDGIERMRARRGGFGLAPGHETPRGDVELCSGPGKLTEALGIGLGSNGADLTRNPFLLQPPLPGEEPEVVTAPRVGITKATDRPWRFCATGSPYVSNPHPR
jgi:DNA-3-methyladenine glycosylase